MVRLTWLAYAFSAVAALASSDASDAVEAEVAADGESIVRSHRVESHATPGVVPLPSAAVPVNEDERSTRGSADVTSQASLVVFQKELEVLESLVELQVRKLHTLEKMRASLIESSASHDEEITGARRHRTQQASRRELTEAVDRKLEAVAARVMATQSQTRFDSFFIEKALIDLEEDVVDVKMGKLMKLPTQDLVVLATRSGRVRVLLSSGQEMLRLDTELSPLASVQLETASDPPVLTVLSEDPSPHVRVYTLDVRLDEMVSSPDTPVSNTQRPGSIQSITAIKVPATIDDSAHGATRTVAIARSTRRSMLSVAHEDGTMGFYALNGTLLHEVATHAGDIRTIATQRNVVAFANGTSVAIFPMTRQRDPEFQVCHGSLSAVSSIAFDPVFPDVVYAGTADGELLAFALLGNAETPRHCKLVHRAVVARTRTLHVAAMKGYVAAASPNELVVFNVTREDGAVTLARMCSTQLATGDAGSLTGRVALAENGHATVLSVVTSSGLGGQSLLILQSLLPSGDASRGEPELWRGAMFIGMVLTVVLSTQFFFRRQKESSGRFEDSDKWREILERHGRESSVGDAASAAAPPRKFSASKHPDDTYMGDPTMFGATPDMFDTSSSRQKRGTGDLLGEDAELDRKIAEARRETLECSFDEVTDDEY